MSLNRWSVPDRARGRSPGSDSELYERFPAMHIGPSRSQRRANLSSVFSSLFENEDTPRSTSAAETSLLRAYGQDLLSSRNENAIPMHAMKSSHSPESQSIIPPDTDSAQSDVTFRSQGTWPAARRYNPFVPMPGAVNNLRYHEEEARRENEREESPGEEDDNREQTLDESIELTKPRTMVETFRSSSSSYPSEGIRSPASNQDSPEATAAAKALIDDLVRCSSFPTRVLLSRSDATESHPAPLSPERGGYGQPEELAAVGRTSGTDDTRIDSASGSPERVHFKETWSALGTPQVPFDSWPNRGNGKCANCLKTFLDQEFQPEDMDTQGSISQSRFPSSYLPMLAETSFSENNDGPPQSNNPSAMDGRREDMMDMMYIPPSARTANGGRIDSLEMPMLHRTGRAPSPVHKPPSTTTLGQRMHKFKIKKWARKVYLRSKVRLQHGVKAAPFSLPGHNSKGANAIFEKELHKRAGVDNKMRRRNSLGLSWARDKGLKKKDASSQDITRRVSRYMDAVIAKKASIMSMRPSRGRAKTGSSRDFHMGRKKRAVSCPALGTTVG
ncbi:hypothetical protein MGN70_014356 [Eutypa lata]|nr:hypothetical protein MGN70_014356 [Eutypa lata]